MKYDYDSFVGKRFGKLVVKKVVDMNGIKFFYCQCDCGNSKMFDSRNVIRGLSNSCGCGRAVASAKRRIPKETINEIIKLRASNMSYGRISSRLGISRNCVYTYSVQYADVIDRLKDSLEWK